jgi:uncharacterized protein YecE (DUF72 family)
MSATIRIGTQGWSYRDWIGEFYPPGSKQEHYLPFYAQVFDTVELDTTFDHPPQPSIVRSWAKHTPETFRYAAKVPQRITHEARLTKMGEDLAAFATALAPLGPRLGPLLVQLPAEFVRDPGTIGLLDRFLSATPKDVQLAAVAWTEWRDLPRVTEVTADFLYLRWLGDRREVDVYDRVLIDRTASFDQWEKDLRRVLPEVREVYGYFNNHWAGHSPASANEMKKRLGLAPVDAKEFWEQRELF